MAANLGFNIFPTNPYALTRKIDKVLGENEAIVLHFYEFRRSTDTKLIVVVMSSLISSLQTD